MAIAASVPRADELESLLRVTPWMMRVLAAAAEVAAPEWWVAGGLVRRVVWDQKYHGGFDPDLLSDVDLAFFDACDLTPARDADVQSALERVLPNVPWEAKNQAAVHLWYPRKFGVAVPPVESAAEGIGTWAETATAVGVRLLESGDLAVTAAFGLDDILDGVWRWNPRRATEEHFWGRLARIDPTSRWPAVRVIAPV